MITEDEILALCDSAFRTEAVKNYILTTYGELLSPMECIDIAHVITVDLVKAIVTIYHIKTGDETDYVINTVANTMFHIMLGAIAHGLE